MIEEYNRVPMGVSSSTVLRFGYAAVIAILVFSTIQAYRIQGIVSEKQLGITGDTSNRTKLSPSCGVVSGWPAIT